MKILIICGIAWTCAQVIKMFIAIIKAKSKKNDNSGFTVKKFFDSGGMPSSHSATVMALTTNVLINEGVRSDAFAVCCIFAIITMFDAVNVRRAVGELTRRFNDLATDYSSVQEVEIEKVEVVDGHTLPQVIAGALLGIAVGAAMNPIFF